MTCFSTEFLSCSWLPVSLCIENCMCYLAILKGQFIEVLFHLNLKCHQVNSQHPGIGINFEVFSNISITCKGKAQIDITGGIIPENSVQTAVYTELGWSFPGFANFIDE